jgi:hypothetical protein
MKPRVLLLLLLLTIGGLAACGATTTRPAHLSASITGKTDPVIYLVGTSKHLRGTAASPTVGEELTTTNGTWTNNPTSFAYQWQHCTGGTCTNIGTNANTYTIQSSDTGYTIIVIVTATNSAGSASQTSAPTGVVPAAGAPGNTVAPTIAGVPMPSATAITGAGTLTADPGTWANSPTGYTYQWQHCDSTGANCVNATGAGATTSNYTVGVNDTTGTIKVLVTASNASGSSTPASAITGPGPALWGAVGAGGQPSGTTSGGYLKDASLFRMQLLNGSTTADVNAYHADNPHQLLFMYHQGNGALTNPTTYFVGDPCKDANVAITQADAHPGNATYDWFLYYPSGFSSANRLSHYDPQANGGSTVYVMDPADTAWQNDCNTILLNKAHSINLSNGGQDGIYTDNLTLEAHLTVLSSNGQFPAYPIIGATGNYADDTAYNNGQDSWMTSLTSRAHTNGMLTIGNISYGFNVMSDYQTMVATMDGNHEQAFEPIALGSSQDTQDIGTVGEGAYNEAHQKWFIAGFNYAPPSEARQTFAIAQFLQEANGYSVFDLDPEGNAVPTFWPSMIAAMKLGPATGGYQTATSNGHTIYERDFANGVAVWNPSQSASAAITPTPGGTYSGRVCGAVADTCSTVSNVSNVTLAADGGAILLRP